MADDAQSTLYSAHLEGHSKYVYFLLAAAGACIGFAVNKTQTAPLGWSQLPLGAAVACWCTSFCSGALRIQHMNGMLYDNLEMLRVQRGRHPKAGQHPEMIAYATSRLQERMGVTSRKIGFYSEWQFYLLVAGGLFFIAWHILGMYLRLVHH